MSELFDGTEDATTTANPASPDPEPDPSRLPDPVGLTAGVLLALLILLAALVGLEAVGFYLMGVVAGTALTIALAYDR